jgi:hypothetical protein
LFYHLICIIIILGHDTEPEDLSIKAKVIERMNELNVLFGPGDESDTSQPIPDSK